MLGKLLKFVILTRFSKPLLVLFVLLFVFYGFNASRIGGSTGVSSILSLYAVGLTAFFLALSVLTGGIMVFKSDRDYLFTLPLKKYELSLSLFVPQFMINGFGTGVALVSTLATFVSVQFLLLGSLALTLALTSLSILAISLDAKSRVVVALLLVVWTISSLVGFPFTPASVFTGQALDGIATLVLLSIVFTPLALVRLGNVELDLVRNLVRSSSADVTSPTSFIGTTPSAAIYRLNLNTVSFGGRMNMMGTTRFFTKRIRIQRVLFASAAFAVVYAIVGLILDPVRPAVVVSVATVVLTLVTFFMSQSALTNERTWLSLTSLPAKYYFRRLVASRVLSLLIILSPFMAVDIILLAAGIGPALNSIIILGLALPSTYALQVCWAAVVTPIQVKGEDMTMPAQLDLRQLSAVVPLLISILIVTAGMFLLPFAMVGSIVLLTLAATLVYSGRFWGRVVTKLTESGFV